MVNGARPRGHSGKPAVRPVPVLIHPERTRLTPGLPKVPQKAVIRRPLRIWLDAVRVEHQRIPPGPVVPPGAPGSDGQVRPPVPDAEAAEVDVPRPAAVGADERVWRAGVTMADHELVDGRDRRGALERRGDREPLMARVPRRGVLPAGLALAHCGCDALLGAPRER